MGHFMRNILLQALTRRLQRCGVDFVTSRGPRQMTEDVVPRHLQPCSLLVEGLQTSQGLFAEPHRAEFQCQANELQMIIFGHS